MNEKSPVDGIIEHLLNAGELTPGQAVRVREATIAGMAIRDALLRTPLATAEVIAAALEHSAATAPPPPARMALLEDPTTDEDLILPDDLSLINPHDEESRTTQSDVQLLDPKDLVHQASHEPGKGVTPLPDDIHEELDMDLEDFDFGDAAEPAPVPVLLADLDDDLILPEDEVTESAVAMPTPAELRAPSKKPPKPVPGDTSFATDVSFLLDEAFSDADGESTAAVQEPTLQKLALPKDVNIFLKAVRVPQTYDLNYDEGDAAAHEAYHLLGESVILSRRGLILNLRKSHQNVALYDPDGKLEEERTLSKELLGQVVYRLKKMGRILPHEAKVQYGQCSLDFEGEKSRALMETDGGKPGADQITVHLISA